MTKTLEELDAERPAIDALHDVDYHAFCHRKRRWLAEQAEAYVARKRKKDRKRGKDGSQ